MASVNKKKKFTETTHEGAPAKQASLLQQLKRTVMTCLLWEDNFYEDGVSVSDRIKELSAKLPAQDVFDVAIEAREQMYLRHVPIFLAVQMAKTEDGRKLLADLLARICTRPDDMQEFLALYWKENGDSKPVVNQGKKGLAKAFKRFDEYQLAKYNGGTKSVKLRDVLCLARPKPENEVQSSLWKKLLENTLATPKTWEVEISARGNKAEVWQELLAEKKLPALATLRNIRNMKNSGVSESVIRGAIDNINSAKLAPITFISAARHNAGFEAQLETKFMECFTNVEKRDGRTVILVDVSGSMDSSISGRSEIQRLDAACTVAMIAREIYKDCAVYTFSYGLKEVPARRGFALKDAIYNSQPHGGTDLGGALQHIHNSVEYDRLIVITDEQSHTAIPNAVTKKEYVINVAPYQNGVSYKNGYQHIDGWSDKVVKYINEVENKNNE